MRENRTGQFEDDERDGDYENVQDYENAKFENRRENKDEEVSNVHYGKPNVATMQSLE